MSSRLAAWLRHGPLLALAIVFVTSRIVYRSAGVRFDASPLHYFIQYIPVWLIEHDFARSLLYLHQQAPLQNVLAGGAWRLFGPTRSAVVLDGVYLAMGFALGVALLHALRRLGVGAGAAAIAASLFLASPVTVLYESWLFYHMPVAALLVLALVALLGYYREGTFRAGLLFFSLLAAVALFRNVYGPIWIGAVAIALAVRPPLAGTSRAAVLWAAAVPIALLALHAAKTSLLVGGYGGAMASVNVVTKTWKYVPAGERERLREEGVISRSVEHEPFTALGKLGHMRLPHAPTGVPLLDRESMPDGRNNPHTLEYVRIARAYHAPDAWYLVRHYPGAYAEAVGFALLDWYVSSPTRDMILGGTSNYAAVKALDQRLNALAGASPDGRLLLLVVCLPLAFGYGAYRVLRTRARLASERSTVAAATFMLITIAYVTTGTTLISYGDFSRYRFDVDPFYLVLFVLLLQHAWRRLRRLARRTPTLQGEPAQESSAAQSFCLASHTAK